MTPCSNRSCDHLSPPLSTRRSLGWLNVAALRFLMLLVLLALLDVRWARPSHGEQPDSSSRKSRVVCFGDSITNRGYGEVLSRLVGVDAINAGVGGNSTAKGLRRMSTDVLALQPDVVVILFGTNDLRADAEKVYVPVAKYKANLENMIAQCRKQNVKVVLCTLPPIEHDAFFTRHNREPFDAVGGLAKLIERYRDAAIEVAKEQKTSLVDLNRLLAKEPTWLSKDGVHPSVDGTAIIAKYIAQSVGPLVADRSSVPDPDAK